MYKMLMFSAQYISAIFLPSLVSALSVQKPIQQRQSFIETSIFRPRPDLLATIAEPEQHMYDDFTEDIPYQGIAFFAHLNSSNCFSPSSDGTFDIGIVGAPFDLGVSYRP